METQRETAVGPELEDLRSQLDQWRQNRKRGSRVPKELWDAAVLLTKDYSVSQLSRVLGLHYDQLTKRVKSASASQDSAGENAPPSVFVEMGAQPPALSADCVLEFEDSRGLKVRMYFRKPGDLDLSEVSKAFWRNGR